MKWKGLILAGGTGSRLFPLTLNVNKHLLPIYDKPMIYYPLSTLMLSGIREFVIVSQIETIPQLQELLGTGGQWGVSFEYVEQTEPRGIAHGLIVAEQQLRNSNVAMILGDNIFYGTGLPHQIIRAMEHHEGATIFGYEVNDPNSFGIVEIDKDGKPIHIEEKPKNPRSRIAIPGLYFFDKNILEIGRSIKPSARGELEITEILKIYMNQHKLRLFQLGRGTAWLDGGTHHDLYEANQFVKIFEDRTGLKIASPEEIAYRLGYIETDNLFKLVQSYPENSYSEYLLRLARES